MKFALAILAASFALNAEARRHRHSDGDRDGDRHRDRFTSTMAMCNYAEEGEGTVMGMTYFNQRDALEGEDPFPVHYKTRWSNLDADEAHTFALFDDDVADCAGTDLGASINGFTTDADGNGRAYGENASWMLSGDSSIIGKYLQLSDADGAVACCQIMMHEAPSHDEPNTTLGHSSHGKGRGSRGEGKKGNGHRSLADLLQN